MVANLDLYESIERSKFYKIEYQKLLIDIKINVKMKIAVALAGASVARVFMPRKGVNSDSFRSF